MKPNPNPANGNGSKLPGSPATPKTPLADGKVADRQVLPLMKTFDEAAALYEKEKEAYYLAAFMQVSGLT